jgi:hypothetical protein
VHEFLQRHRAPPASAQAPIAISGHVLRQAQAQGLLSDTGVAGVPCPTCVRRLSAIPHLGDKPNLGMDHSSDWDRNTRVGSATAQQTRSRAP